MSIRVDQNGKGPISFCRIIIFLEKRFHLAIISSKLSDSIHRSEVEKDLGRRSMVDTLGWMQLSTILG